MLRLLVLILLLANGLFFAWSQGHLLNLGLGPAQQTEPHRLEQQIRPDVLRVVGADEARRLEAAVAPAAAPQCLQAGPIDDSGAAAVRVALQAWPAGTWTLEPMVEPPRWIVYMGKYASFDLVNRKKAELRQIGVSFEPLSNPDLELGLSLGGFGNLNAANQHLERLAERGVRTARVVQERPEMRGQRLILPALDDAQRARLDELRNLLGARAFRPCR